MDSSPASVVANVPDAMATEIPPSLLEFSAGTVNMSAINRRQWTSDQVSMPLMAKKMFKLKSHLIPFYFPPKHIYLKAKTKKLLCALKA